VVGVTDAKDAFDELLGQTDGPMWILTVSTGRERAGCLVGFATQVSIDPARFLACVSKINHTFGPAMRAEHVAVHVAPTGDDDGLARLFGEETGDEVDKFERCEWHEGAEGQPILDGCSGWFVGHVVARHDVGDHVGLVLEPVAVQGRVEDPMTLDEAKKLDAGHPA
jgi:flavin reductase (DIM6/NTAB) family NADH-FMN oxidoreductase RutF